MKPVENHGVQAKELGGEITPEMVEMAAQILSECGILAFEGPMVLLPVREALEATLLSHPNISQGT